MVGYIVFIVVSYYVTCFTLTNIYKIYVYKIRTYIVIYMFKPRTPLHCLRPNKCFKGYVYSDRVISMDAVYTIG